MFIFKAKNLNNLKIKLKVCHYSKMKKIKINKINQFS